MKGNVKKKIKIIIKKTNNDMMNNEINFQIKKLTSHIVF